MPVLCTNVKMKLDNKNHTAELHHLGMHLIGAELGAKSLFRYSLPLLLTVNLVLESTNNDVN